MLSQTIFTSLFYLSLSQFLPVVFSSNATQCQPWTVDKPNRIFVLSDVANEPDDTMSLVRLLVHSDMYTVEGLVAITSFWLPNATYPNQIQDLVNAYGIVRDNLQSHSNLTFPTVEELSSKIKSGPVSYGMEAIKDLEQGGKLSEGSQLLIDSVDASDEPLYVQVWGGANTLASALWQVNRTRSTTELQAFTSKLRVYSISDQDDTGEWVRHHFYDVRFVGTRAGFNQYSLSTWVGISSPSIDVGGANQEIVSKEWLHQNIQIGELGKHYPDVEFIMEGDTPALLFNFQNGLNNPERPDWGSWGGRYNPNPFNHYANSNSTQYMDAIDQVVGMDGRTYRTNQATIWRWREPIQQEFAQRMQWTLSARNSSSNTTHPPIVVVNDSCGSAALELNVNVGDEITLDATKTYSPDANANLNFTWFQYSEPSAFQNSNAAVPKLNFTYSASSDSESAPPAGSVVRFTIPPPVFGDCVLPENITKFGRDGEQQKCPVLHAILTVRDVNTEHPIVRYKRVVLRVQPYSNQQ